MTSVRFTEDLRGFTVGVTADRRRDEQALLLGRLGVGVVQGPTVRTLPVAAGEGLRAATEAVIARPPDILVANTGLGIRGWFAMAETWALDAALRDALARSRIACRGPKAAGAILTAGLVVWWRAPSEQLGEVADHLIAQGARGLRIAFQLHGDRRQSLTERLAAAGADVVELPVYRWTLPDQGGPAAHLIDLCCAGTVDAVTFTAAPAVRNLFELAGAGRAGPLRDALNAGILVACMGPVCAAAAVEEGISAPIVPAHWRLGALVRAVGEQLALRRSRYRVGETSLVLQGSVALVDGAAVELTNRERDVLRAVAARPGVVVTRASLLQRVWSERGADSHALEAVVGRLRAKLGPAGAAVNTVVRRGYSFVAEPAAEAEVRGAEPAAEAERGRV
ncbi:MAG: uroporphyrinogen-III synthase [Acidimicrobiales bacterium]